MFLFSLHQFPTRTITIPRGGGTTLKFKVNLPLLCTDGQPCYMDFKMYDIDDDYTCQDSTIAFKVLLFLVWTTTQHLFNIVTMVTTTYKYIIEPAARTSY